jgi:hypothetical protein
MKLRTLGQEIATTTKPTRLTWSAMSQAISAVPIDHPAGSPS